MDAEERAHKRDILRVKRERRRELEKQVAFFGMKVDAHITMELRQLQKEILQLEKELGEPSEERTAPKSEESSHVDADVKRARMLVGRPLPPRPYYPVEAPRQSILEFFAGNPVLLMLVGAATLTVFLLASAPSRTGLRNLLTREPQRAIYAPGDRVSLRDTIVSLEAYSVQDNSVDLYWRFLIHNQNRSHLDFNFAPFVDNNNRYLNAEKTRSDCQETPYDNYFGLSSLPSGMLECRETVRVYFVDGTTTYIVINLNHIGAVPETRWKVSVVSDGS